MGKYYWLKLKDDFFQEEFIEWLKEQGDEMDVVVYLKLCLLSVKNGGLLYREICQAKIPYTNEGLAKAIGSCEADVERVVDNCIYVGLIERVEDGLMMTKIPSMLGTSSNTENAMRQARWRARQKEKALEIKEEPKEDETAEVVEEKPEKPKKSTTAIPTLEDVKAYIAEKSLNVDAEFFFNYYSTADWTDAKGNKVKNWKQRLITWDRKEREQNRNGGAGNSKNSKTKASSRRNEPTTDWSNESGGW